MPHHATSTAVVENEQFLRVVFIDKTTYSAFPPPSGLERHLWCIKVRRQCFKAMLRYNYYLSL